MTADTGATFCVYDGPGPDAIQRAASATGLPVDAITEVHVFGPYFYH